MPIPELPFEGIAYDRGRAEALADALSATVAQARLPDVVTGDLLAGLGVTVARVIAGTKLDRAPEVIAQRLAAFVVSHVLAIRREPG